MTSETKTEIVIFSALAGVALLFLLMHRGAVANGLAAAPGAVTTGSGGGAFDFGGSPYTDNSVINMAGSTLNAGGLTLGGAGLNVNNPGSCGCGCPDGSQLKPFGSAGDLATWLANDPATMALASSYQNAA